MSENPGQPNGANKVILAAVALVVVVAAAVGATYVAMKNSPDASAPAAQQQTDATTPPAAQQNQQAQPQQAQNQDDVGEVMGGEFNGTPVRPGNPVVAKVDGKDVTRVDVYRFIQTLPPQVQQLPATQVYPLALEQTINTRIVQNRAESANLESTPEFQQEVEMAKQQIARNLYIQKEVESSITEDELRADYERLVVQAPEMEERKASHILVDTKEKADELIKKIEGGAKLTDLAKTESKDPTAKANAGDLGYFTKVDMIPEFAEAVFAMKKGEITKEPVKTTFGWHVIQLEDVRNRVKPSYEEIKPALVIQKRREKLDALMKQWRDAAKVEVFDINGDPQAAQPAAPAPGADAPAAQ